MKVDLSGRRVVVTAGGAGIGRVIADAFVAAGAHVAVCDISSEALADLPLLGGEMGRTNGAVKLAGGPADVGDPKSINAFFARAIEWLSGLDVLVNNAGISGPTREIEDVSPEEWEEVLSVNVSGQFYAARRAIPIFKRQGGGTIVNISSTAGRIGMPLRVPYSTSKYAVRGFTEALAVELGEHNIRVNAILPGLVDGPRGRRVIAEQAQATGKSLEDYLPMVLHNISMHAMISPEEVAAMAVFLSSDHARHVSGQSIGVCGNFESYRAPLQIGPV